jgi:hypothetical protein
MPYSIIHSGRGYKVRSINGTILSKHPLPLSVAQRQKKAVELSELRKEGVIPPRKFIR